MRVVVTRAAKLVVVLTLAFGIAAFVSSGVEGILLDVYLVAIGGVFLLALVRTTRVQAPVERISRFEESACADAAAAVGYRRARARA